MSAVFQEDHGHKFPAPGAVVWYKDPSLDPMLSLYPIMRTGSTNIARGESIFACHGRQG